MNVGISPFLPDHIRDRDAIVKSYPPQELPMPRMFTTRPMRRRPALGQLPLELLHRRLRVTHQVRARATAV
jgi:hypothetical protein